MVLQKCISFIRLLIYISCARDFIGENPYNIDICARSLYYTMFCYISKGIKQFFDEFSQATWVLMTYLTIIVTFQQFYT